MSSPPSTNGLVFSFSTSGKNNEDGTIKWTIRISNNFGIHRTKTILISGYKKRGHKSYVGVQRALSALIIERLITTKTTSLPTEITGLTAENLGIIMPEPPNGVQFSFSTSEKNNEQGTIKLTITISNGSGISMLKEIIIYGYQTASERKKATPIVDDKMQKYLDTLNSRITTKATSLPSEIIESTPDSLGVIFPEPTEGIKLSLSILGKNDAAGIIKLKVTISNGFGEVL